MTDTNAQASGWGEARERGDAGKLSAVTLPSPSRSLLRVAAGAATTPVCSRVLQVAAVMNYAPICFQQQEAQHAKGKIGVIF